MLTLNCQIRLPWCQKELTLPFPAGETVEHLRTLLAEHTQTTGVVLVSNNKILLPDQTIEHDMVIKVIPQAHGG